MSSAPIVTWVSPLLLAGLLLGCEKKSEPDASAGSAAPAVSSAASQPVAVTSPLKLLASASNELELMGANENGVVLAVGHGLLIKSAKLAEHPTLHQGLENPRWSELRSFALGDELAVLAGKRDPEKLWQGDELMYMEDKAIGAERTVFRWFKRGAWVRVSAVKEGESFRGMGNYKGRVVTAIEMPGGTDYRFQLLAGKPGIALPAPGATDKPKQEEPPAEVAQPVSDADAGGAVDAAGATMDAAAPPVATETAPAKPEPPPDPNLPHPDNDECATRLVPRAFAGSEDGEAYVAGRVCPGSGAWWVEHWPAGKRKSGFEKLPAQPAGQDVRVVASLAGEAYLAELGTRFLLLRSGDQWKKLEPPGTGSVSFIAASPKGRVWLIIGGKVFSRQGAGEWAELVLPEGKSASAVLPADGGLTFVACGTELYGPSAAGVEEPVKIGPGASVLCQAPYVIVERKVKRTKRYPELVEKLKKTGISGVELVFGHRGMTGEDSVQAKAPDMKTALALAKALGGADIVCGAPRTEAKVPE